MFGGFLLGGLIEGAVWASAFKAFWGCSERCVAGRVIV